MNLISNLDLMLSMDSGNAHIAALLGVKVVTIWGVTHPFAGFAPFNQPNDYALIADRDGVDKSEALAGIGVVARGRGPVREGDELPQRHCRHITGSTRRWR